jgi:SAM-dependent methyltransferase
MVANWLRRTLEHPLTRGLDLDSPQTTQLRRQIIAGKPFLKRCYQHWYEQIRDCLPPGEGAVLEIGSGAGHLRQYVPDAITSEVFVVDDLSLVLDAHRLPFADASLRAVAMVDVLHHLPAVTRFVASCTRCVRPGGRVVMIEPWVTPWSKVIYTRLHHEPFLPDAAQWHFEGAGPLSDANGALPWILFHRDRARFEREFPLWRIERVQPIMPLTYLLSGGVSMRSLMPGWSFAPWRLLESALPQRWFAMFALIVLERQ